MPFWRLFYHFVWHTWNGEPLIAPTWENDLHRVIAAKGVQLGVIVHVVGGVENHVHLVVSVPPKLPLPTFIGQVKGNSSHFVNHVLHPDKQFAWQEEYGVVSLGEKSLGAVIDYVKNQHAHHAEGKTVPLFEQTSPDRA